MCLKTECENYVVLQNVIKALWDLDKIGLIQAITKIVCGVKS